jgi:phosphatidylinositol glycan class O
MCFGLLVFSACLVASYSLYTNYAREPERDKWLASLTVRAGFYTVLGTALGLVAHTLPIPFLSGVTLLHLLVFSASLSSSLSIILLSPPAFPSFTLSNLFPLLHSLSFLSNSYTFWEDHSLPFLLLSSLLPYLFLSLQPTTPKNLRTRMLTHLLSLTLCTRLMAISTVCREEQQPYCHVTFFASRSVPEPPRLVLYLILPIALVLPHIIQRWFVGRKQHWSVSFFFDWVLRPSLAGGTLFWIVEWVDSAGFLANDNNGTSDWTRLLRTIRTRIAWGAMGWLVLAGGACWWVCPPGRYSKNAADDEEDDSTDHFSTRFLVFWSVFFGIVWVCTQLTGQAVLALGTIALLSYLELASCARELSSTTTTEPALTHPTPLALLTLLTFYSTGHQAAFSSIQWKAGFVLTENVHVPSSSSPSSTSLTSVLTFLNSTPALAWLAALLERATSINITYPLSGLTVVLNSVGGVAVFGGLGAGLVGCWRPATRPPPSTKSPPPSPSSTQPAAPSAPPRPCTALTPLQSAHLSTLSTQTYFLLLLLGSSLGAAVLRRHLMVWKVFAPRFMVGVLELVVVDVAAVVGGLAMRLGRGRKGLL